MASVFASTSEALCSRQCTSCSDGQSEVSTDCSEGESLSPPKEPECESPRLWKIPPPFPQCFRRGRTRSKEFFADHELLQYQIEESLSAGSPKKMPVTPKKRGIPGPKSPMSSTCKEPSVPPSTPMRLPAAALWSSEIDSSMTETPKAKKEIVSTPPSGPAMLQRRLRDDIEAALCRKSLPLLSLALMRGHCCGADHCLHEAVRRQHVKALKFLLQHSTSLQVDEHCNALRPLHNAILHAMSKDGAGFQMAEALLSFGASPNSCRGDDSTLGSPLHMAAKRGSVPMVTLLLAHGADPNALDASGQTPMHVACRRMSFQPGVVEDKVVRLLLSHGANPVCADDYGLTPSDCAHTMGMKKLLRQATKSWAQQQLASARGAVDGRADQQVPWVLPDILNTLASYI